MIRFRCSHCKKKFGVPDEYAGHRIRCNTCSHHTIVPATSTEPASVPVEPLPLPDTDRPALYDDKTDEDMVLSLSQEDWVAATDQREVDGETNSTPSQQDTPLQLQFQSFHNYQPPPSESRIDKSDLDEPDPKNSVSELVERCRPDLKTDKIERAINILSNIASIGPSFFIFIIFSVFFIMYYNGSPRAIKPPFGIPDTGLITGPVSFLAAFPTIRHAFYVCAFGISPLALIAALYLVFRYRQDIPKSLYVVICVYGLILFVFLGA